MPLTAAVIRELVAAGVTGDALVTACERIEAAEKPVRSKAAERTARWRERNAERHGDVTSVTCDVSPTPPIDNNKPSLGLSDNTPQPPKVLRCHGTNPRALGINPRSLDAEPDGFQPFWAAYPKRDGNADRKGAAKAFRAAVQRAGGHESIVLAASRYAAHCRDKGKIGTEFVKQARAWLNGDLWAEWLPQEPARAAVNRVMVREGSAAWDAWKATGRRFNAMDLKNEHGHVIGRGWYFETEFPTQEQAA